MTDRQLYLIPGSTRDPIFPLTQSPKFDIEKSFIYYAYKVLGSLDRLPNTTTIPTLPFEKDL
jgi:hypothetical protein